MDKKALLKKWILFGALITSASFIAALVASLLGVAVVAIVLPSLVDEGFAPKTKRWAKLLAAFVFMELGFLMVAISTIGLVAFSPTIIIMVGLIDGAIFFCLGCVVAYYRRRIRIA